MNDRRPRREPPLRVIGKRIEYWNRAFWIRVLKHVWPNEPLGRRLDPREVRRVLFLRYDAIGDMITTLPAIRLVKRINPAIEVDVLASPANRAVVEHDPHVTRVHTLRARPDLFVRDLNAARRVGYDLVIGCIFAKATKIGIIANWVALPGAVKATMWRGERYYCFFNIQPRDAAAQASMWDKMTRLIPEVFEYELQPGDEQPYIALDDASRDAARERLRQLAMPEGRFALMNITSNRPWNQWTEEGYRALAEAILADDAGNRVVIVCMGADRKIAERIIAAQPEERRARIALYPPTRNVLEIVALVACSEIVFSLDTGVVHMASATARPTLALYVATDHSPAEWRPYGVMHRAVATDEPHVDVSTIAPERVVREFLELLHEARATDVHTVEERGGLALDWERYYW